MVGRIVLVQTNFFGDKLEKPLAKGKVFETVTHPHAMIEHKEPLAFNAQ
jgi:hypothetical protein